MDAIFPWLAELAMKRLWDFWAVTARRWQHRRRWRAASSCCLALARSGGIRIRHRAGRAISHSALAAALRGACSPLRTFSFRPVTAALLILALIRLAPPARPAHAAEIGAPSGCAAADGVAVNIHFFALLVPLWTGALFVGDIIEIATLRSAVARGRDLLLTILCAGRVYC